MGQETRIVHVVGAAIVRRGRCLVTQRGAASANSFEWELPGGKVEPGESPRQALEREIAEELGLVILVGDYLGRGTSQLGDRQIVLDVFVASIQTGTLRLTEHRKALWIEPSQIPDLDWSAADRPVLRALIERLRNDTGLVD